MNDVKKSPNDFIKSVLSSEELWYLLNLYAPTAVIGIENPYTGRFVDEIKNSEQNALNGLMSRQIVHLTDKNSLEFTDPAVKTMIETCLKPEQCLWMIVSHGGEKKIVSQRLVYFSDEQIVDVDREGEHSYKLTTIQDTEALKTLLTAYLSPAAEDEGASTDFVLEQTAFDAAIKAFFKGDDQTGIQILSAAGLNEPSCEELKSALGEEGNSTLAIYMCNPSQPDACNIKGLGYLKGRMGGWMIQEYEKKGSKFVDFQSGKAREFRELTFSLF